MNDKKSDSTAILIETGFLTESKKQEVIDIIQRTLKKELGEWSRITTRDYREEYGGVVIYQP